jgi:hypothetical protein
MTIAQRFMILIDPDNLVGATGTSQTLTADQYVEEVEGVIRSLAGTEAGSAVLETIRLWNKLVRIAPVHQWDPAKCPGASADYAEAKDFVINTTVRRFLKRFGLDSRPIGAVVRFTPRHYGPTGVCHKQEGPGTYAPSPEEVLIHELTHAIRMLSRTMNRKPMAHGGLAQYDSPEEFIAILVQNVFQSEVKRHLRASHRGYRIMEQDLQDSFAFFKASRLAFKFVDDFCRTNPHFTRRLSGVKAPFNPIAAYYKDQKKARALSSSPDAAAADLGLLGLFRLLTR